MAINFLNDVSFNKNEIIQPVLENQANDASAGTPVDGQLYYNTTDNVCLLYTSPSPRDGLLSRMPSSA